MTPLRAPLTYLSQFQPGLFDRIHQPRSADFVLAFSWFGQGVLDDPRRANATSDIAAEIHTMDGNPPRAYHGWFAFMRAMILLGIDVDRWTRIAPVVAFAWALQSIAKPHPRDPNPGLPAAVVTEQAARWLPRTIKQLDKDFQSAPYPQGIG
ncbi:hypothetical protein LWC34_15475 [Kibdelosporangium philippinense]|uniref:Uncharacterized protein n=1 Tax=Kibdelosporangium philippinense TaxID=211113 RepID=A0ABS8ZBM6_9PSEU|nr:hypothetical protein [Kibdelosporangium philippinense]MCE7004225.1 hypothetical protein [Kibdelosporangium philippinense]